MGVVFQKKEHWKANCELTEKVESLICPKSRLMKAVFWWVALGCDFGDVGSLGGGGGGIVWLMWDDEFGVV